MVLCGGIDQVEIPSPISHLIISLSSHSFDTSSYYFFFLILPHLAEKCRFSKICKSQNWKEKKKGKKWYENINFGECSKIWNQLLRDVSPTFDFSCLWLMYVLFVLHKYLDKKTIYKCKGIL